VLTQVARTRVTRFFEIGATHLGHSLMSRH